MSFFIPDCGIVPEALKSAVAEVGEYYLVKNLSLHEFVEQAFLNTFVKQGERTKIRRVIETLLSVSTVCFLRMFIYHIFTYKEAQSSLKQNHKNTTKRINLKNKVNVR